jgi:hypothetical protein
MATVQACAWDTGADVTDPARFAASVASVLGLPLPPASLMVLAGGQEIPFSRNRESERCVGHNLFPPFLGLLNISY